MSLRAAGLGLLVVLAAAPAAFGCSLGEGTLLPTNYELVQETETIVLARAVDETPWPANPSPGHIRLPSTTFRLVRILRGSYPEKTLKLPGGYPFAGASPENDFSRARPGAYSGSCSAFDYRLGRLYVLFLEREKGVWRQHAPAFSRINEEVASEASPWVAAVREYSRIADLGSYARSRAALETLTRSKVPGLAADVARHFLAATPAKSDDDLLVLEAAATTDTARANALWAFAAHVDSKVAASRFHQLLSPPDLPEWAEGPACSWALRSRPSAEFSNFLRHALRRPAGRQWYFASVLAALATPDDVDALQPYLDLLTGEEAKVFYGDADALAASPAMRTDLERRVGGDYRARYELALVLARWGDTKVLEWALAEGCSRGDDPWIPCYVFAVSPLPAAGAEITRLFGRPDATAAAFIVDGLASSARTDRLELVRAALSRFPSSSKLQDAARRALSALEQQGDSGAEALLATLPDEPDDD